MCLSGALLLSCQDASERLNPCRLDKSCAEEARSTYKGTRLQYFSRVYTDCITNKRSIVIAMESGNCTDVMPPTYWSFKAWKQAVYVDYASSGSGNAAMPKLPDQGTILSPS